MLYYHTLKTFEMALKSTSTWRQIFGKILYLRNCP